MNKLTILTFLATLVVVPAVSAQVESDTGDQQEGATEGTEINETGTQSNAVDFNSLSKGNQKIARALMDAQVMPADDTTGIWTLDDIAAARNEAGWGRVFQQMQSEGRVSAGNLGEVVSRYQHTLVTPGTASENTASHSVINSFDDGKPGKENHAAAGAPVEMNNGNAYGLNRGSGQGITNGIQHGRPGADHGITTAAGIEISSGLNNAGLGGNSNAGANGAGHAYGRGGK